MGEVEVRLTGNLAYAGPHGEGMKIELYAGRRPDGRLNIDLKQNRSPKNPIDSTVDYLMRIFKEGSNIIFIRPDSVNELYGNVCVNFGKEFRTL